MKPYWQIINKYFPEGCKARSYYIPHVESVTKMALNICRKHSELNVNMELVETAAMLHDIGIFYVNAPEIGCYGSAPYIQHGILGAEIVRKEGLPEIACFCENHIGTGITKEEIIHYELLLPHRDMVPETFEQKIVTFSDKFFSKSRKNLTKPKSIEKIQQSLSKYGTHKICIFEKWGTLFE